jgi:hypothetical protein
VSIPEDSLREYATQEQEAVNAKHRRSALVGLLEQVQHQHGTAVDLVDLAGLLGLDEELEQLAGSRRLNPERHRRLAAARAELEPAEAELGDESR